MKITNEQLKQIILEELSEAYGSLGPDDETEKGPQIQTMDKEAFLEKQYMHWMNEFNAESWDEGELINKVLESAYDNIAKAFELDETGLYENKEK